MTLADHAVPPYHSTGKRNSDGSRISLVYPDLHLRTSVCEPMIIQEQLARLLRAPMRPRDSLTLGSGGWYIAARRLRFRKWDEDGSLGSKSTETPVGTRRPPCTNLVIVRATADHVATPAL